MFIIIRRKLIGIRENPILFIKYMKQLFLIADSAKYEGKEVQIRGWIYNKRSSGGLIFLHVRDGSGFIQVTAIKDKVIDTVFKAVSECTLESSAEITGILKKEPRAPGGYEVILHNFNLVHKATDEFPIGKKDHGPDFLLSNRHLWIRSSRQWAILRIRNTIERYIQDYYRENHFIRLDTPMVTPSACEGTTTLFELDYFGEKAYLSQSGQLYLEAAIASFGRCYDFSPVLRAEKSKTRRHLIEFWMTNAEAAFVNFEENMDIQESMIKYILSHILSDNASEFAILKRDTTILKKTIQTPFLRITFKDAVDVLRKLGSDMTYDTDFGNDDETLLMNHFEVPVFITHYPAHVKAFYCRRYVRDETVALSADLLAP